MANPIVTGLPAYIEEHNLPLLAKAVLGGKSIGMLNVQTSVKGPTALNLLSTEVVFQDGSDCGWSASGNTELSQRVLNPAYLKINTNFCEKKLLKKWTEYQVKIAAGMKTLPFEEDFVNQIVDGVNEKLEKMIWQGVSGATSFDGFITILSGSSANEIEMTTGTSVYSALKEVYLAIPEAIVEKEDCAIFVSPAVFRQFIQELVTANLYHFNPDDQAGEYALPGTGTKVISVAGLANTGATDYIVAGRKSNMFYGTDLEGDENKVEFWYSQDNREFRLAIEWLSGVQVAFPDEMTVGYLPKGE